VTAVKNPPGEVTVAGYSFSAKALEAVIIVTVLFLVYTAVASRARRGLLRRLGVCALIAAVLSAAVVAWAERNRHAALAAHAVKTRTPVPVILVAGWSGLLIAGTIVLFLIATWARARRSTPRRPPHRRSRRRGPEVPFGGMVPGPGQHGPVAGLPPDWAPKFRQPQRRGRRWRR
jgi:hypothetical protein